MKRVVRIQDKGKVKDVGLRGLSTVPAAKDVDSTVALIQALIPLGLKAVAEALEAEVVALAGEWYRRTGGQPGLVRWSQERGSVYLADQKLPISYTRVRDLLENREIPLRLFPPLAHPGARPRPSGGGRPCASTPPGAPALRPLTEAGEGPRDHGAPGVAGPCGIARRFWPWPARWLRSQPSFCFAIVTTWVIACSKALKLGNAFTS